MEHLQSCSVLHGHQHSALRWPEIDRQREKEREGGSVGEGERDEIGGRPGHKREPVPQWKENRNIETQTLNVSPLIHNTYTQVHVEPPHSLSQSYLYQIHILLLLQTQIKQHQTHSRMHCHVYLQLMHTHALCVGYLALPQTSDLRQPLRQCTCMCYREYFDVTQF